MKRSTLTFLAYSGSLGAAILMANSATATPVVASATNPIISTPTAQVVNLNRVTPTLNFTQQQTNPIKDLLGCQCATCTKAASQI